MYEKLLTPRPLWVFSHHKENSPFSAIHPYAVEQVKAVVSRLSGVAEVILVYGSATGDFMRDNSDIDIAVISALPEREIVEMSGKVPERELDIKCFTSVEDLTTQAEGFFPTPNTIVKEGVVVYIKDKEISLYDVQGSH